MSAASVKGPFAIDLPLTGPSGVEDRSGGPNKKYTVVMTFDQNIVSVGSASSTCGSVQSIVIDSADPHKVKINLVNVAHGCNGSTITVTADSITDDQGNVLDSASVGLGLLLGDVNADRVVNHSDYNEAQMHKGQKTDQENFRNDVNANGHIEHSDIALIRQQQGTSLVSADQIYWTSWSTNTAGIIATPQTTISVTYSGELNGLSLNYPSSWKPSTTYADGVVVANAPPRSGNTIQLFGGGSGVNTIRFSAPVINPIVAIWSLGQVGIPAIFEYINATPTLWLAGRLLNLVAAPSTYLATRFPAARGMAL